MTDITFFVGKLDPKTGESKPPDMRAFRLETQRAKDLFDRLFPNSALSVGEIAVVHYDVAVRLLNASFDASIDSETLSTYDV